MWKIEEIFLKCFFTNLSNIFLQEHFPVTLLLEQLKQL